jgi:dihydrofolate reductase
LIRDNLIDQHRLVIHPVVIGHGTSLFAALPGPLRLDVVEVRAFASGTMAHICRPLREDR